MKTHIAYYKDEIGVFFLSVVDSKPIPVNEITENCCMSYTTLSRICGAVGIWTIVSLENIILQLKEEVRVKMQNKDFKNIL